MGRGDFFGYWGSAKVRCMVEWMSMCFPHKLLVKLIAKSCTHTEAACQNMLTDLQPYSKKELCHLMGIGFAWFLEENCDLKITCTAVILVGEHDRIGKVKQYCDAWHRKTQFPLYRIPDAVHNSHFDNSDAVNQIIERFLQDIRRWSGIGDVVTIQPGLCICCKVREKTWCLRCIKPQYVALISTKWFCMAWCL